MSNFWQDLRLALRGMWKQPGFTVIAVVTLALGIGSNTAIFSVIKALILNASNFVEPESVVALWRTSKRNPQKNSVSYIDLQDLRAQSRSFESIAAYKMNTNVTQSVALTPNNNASMTRVRPNAPSKPARRATRVDPLVALRCE